MPSHSVTYGETTDGAANRVSPAAASLPAVSRSPSINSFWIDVYSLALMGLIVAYFVLMMLVAGEAFELSVRLLRQRWELNWTWAASMAGAVLLTAVLVRIARHVIYTAAGLVTTINDDVPQAEEGIALSREEQKTLYDLVEEVGRRVEAPAPDEIRVTFQPECFTVELRRFGIRTRRKLILVLGLPHLSVLTLAELQVILGHELAHFGRGDTRLRVFLTRFATSLQDVIESIGRKWWSRFDPIFWFHRIYYRLFLLLSAPVQRHQELRAESSSAAAFGGSLAASTLLKEWLLADQFMIAVASYDPASQTQSGPPDVFEWFCRRWHDFSPAGQEYLLRRLESEEKRSFWDSHPTIAERVRVIRRFPDQPAADTLQARSIIRNYPQLSHRLHTLMFDET